MAQTYHDNENITLIINLFLTDNVRGIILIKINQYLLTQCLYINTKDGIKSAYE